MRRVLTCCLQSCTAWRVRGAWCRSSVTMSPCPRSASLPPPPGWGASPPRTGRARSRCGSWCGPRTATSSDSAASSCPRWRRQSGGAQSYLSVTQVLCNTSLHACWIAMNYFLCWYKLPMKYIIYQFKKIVFMNIEKSTISNFHNFIAEKNYVEYFIADSGCFSWWCTVCVFRHSVKPSEEATTSN